MQRPHAGRGDGADAGQGHEAGRRRPDRAAPRLHRQPAVDDPPLPTSSTRATLGRLIALYEHRVFVEARCSASTPSTSGASSSARSWRPACCRSSRARSSRRRSDASTVGLVRQIHAWRRGVDGLAIKGILFDKDGTLVDFQATWFAIGDALAMKAAGGDRARADGAAGRGAATISRRHRFAPIPSSPPAPMPTSSRSGIREADGRPSAQAMVADFDSFTAEAGRAPARVPLPGSRRRSRSCTGRLRLGVATNDSTGGAEKTLLALGIAQMFDAAYGYDARRQPEAGARHDLRLLRSDRAEAVADRHGRRQPPRSRNGAGRRRGACGRRALRHRHARVAGADGRRVLGSIAELPDYLSSGDRPGSRRHFARRGH